VVRGVAALLIAAMLVPACSSDESTVPTRTTPVAAPAPSFASVPSVHVADVPPPCSILGADDFAAAGVPVEGAGVDTSASIGLATTSSAACQWSGKGTWDLLVGRGGAATAYEFDRGFFAELDTVADLEAGDVGYILDREDVATPEDYDHEAGVVIGDLYFTLSTTDDDGAAAVELLAKVVAGRLETSG
jgi:hypothetical protein